MLGYVVFSGFWRVLWGGESATAFFTVKFMSVSWTCAGEREKHGLYSPWTWAQGASCLVLSGSISPGGEKCVCGTAAGRRQLHHFFLKLIKVGILTSFQFLVICRKDQSRNVKQADAVAYSSCNLARAVRRDSGTEDRFALYFPFCFRCAVGLLKETSVLLHSLSDTVLGNMWVDS